MAKQEASASEDSSFLASEVQALMQEKQQLKDKVQQLERERQFLLEANRLLHRQVEGASAGPPTTKVVPSKPSCPALSWTTAAAANVLQLHHVSASTAEHVCQPPHLGVWV